MKTKRSTNFGTPPGSRLVYSELLDAMVDNCSEEWRNECECSAILAMPGKHARNRFIDGDADPATGRLIRKGVAGHRGKEAAAKLRADVIRLFNIRKQKQQEQSS